MTVHRAILSLGAMALGLSAPSFAEQVALPDLGSRAAQAFQGTCLATRGQGQDAAIAAIRALPGVIEGPNLPAFGGGAPMRTFKDGELEYMVRPGKKGRYGCFVALESDADGTRANSIKSALDGVSGLAPKPVKPGKKVVHNWTIAGSKDEIRLVPYISVGGILINLEVN